MLVRHLLIVSICTLMLWSPTTWAQTASVVLTGNTADTTRPDDLLKTIESYCLVNKQPVIWALNGDLFPRQTDEQSIRSWQSQLYALLDRFTNLQIVINQGDRDWDDSGRTGWSKIKSLDKLLDEKKHDRFHAYLKGGCPGPWILDAANNLEIVIINSQWWNHPYEKPTPSSADCSIADTDIFIEELEGILDEGGNKNMVILSHFPVESLGNYGGRFSPATRILPPVYGDIKIGFHQNIGSSKDISNAYFQEYRQKITDALQNYSSLIFASGHEGNHFILKEGPNYAINSGALQSGSYVAHSSRSPFTSAKPGFLEINYKDDGEVTYQYYELVNNSVTKGKSALLFSSPCRPDSHATTNTRFPACGVSNGVGTTATPHVIVTTTKAVAGEEYASSRLKEKWLGHHYRSSWTTPVQVPYLDMDSTFGGLTVTGKGGGRQTTSLKLSARNGNEYVFRSVNKDPSKALVNALRGTIVSEVLKDQTTTQQPYGAMVVSRLMDKIDVLHATPNLYVLPNDSSLGTYRKQYAELFGMLEVRPTDNIGKDQIFGGATHIVKSFKMIDKLYDDHDNRVDKNEFVRARLFDLWIGDWSKHEDNWKWAGYKTKDGEVFRPIPRDRDHAFSRWDGIIPWIADREWAMPNGENFGYSIKGLRSLMWQARHLDRFVTSEVSKEQWVAQSQHIQQHITEQDIESAVKQMPAEIYSIDGKEIENKLKARIKDLPTYAKRYYDILASEVEVVGSNKSEYFQVQRNADGSVHVSVYDLNHKLHAPILSKVYYDRTFYPKETKEIRLFGLMGDDEFLIAGKAPKSILIRIVSGDGDDRITDSSSISNSKNRTLVYERDSRTSVVKGDNTKWVRPKEESVYTYNRSLFKYNTYLPSALVSYNAFTGFAAQGGVTFTRHRFDKPDFSAKHRLKAAVSTTGNYEFGYGSQVRYLVGKWDGIFDIDIARPLKFNYFFGIGNETKQETERSKNYYRSQYQMGAASAGLTRAFWNKSRASIMASYEIGKAVNRANSYVSDNPDIFGVKTSQLIFLKGSLDLDFRDRPALPEHGFRMLLNQSAGHVSNINGKLTSISELELENYLSTNGQNPITFGLRVGGGVIYGDLPFYKLFSLGQFNDLEGFKRNRFTGRSKAFINSELRWQLAQIRTSYVPLKIGVRGFAALGKVWVDHIDNQEGKWHQGYGAGFYVTPFTEQFAINVSASSSKEEDLLLMVSIGAFFR